VKITKHEHAHLTVEVDGRKLIIDPGVFSSAAGEDDVDAVVVTHEHGDHWTADNLAAIRARNPGIPVYGPAVLAEADGAGDITVVSAGETVTAGRFTLRFVGGDHAPIHPSFTAMVNVGVVVDETLFHPGDSYSLPEGDVPVVAVPIGGPWHKLAESIDWLNEVTPRQAFNLHDETLSAAGQGMANDILARIVASHDGTYTPLAHGQTLEV
jgi:L-ascorbate metabolism protein UlaG (beta-lactamase superfamily)